MDYSVMADILLKKMAVLMRSHSHRKIGEFVEGEMFVLKHLTFVSEKALPSELAAEMNASTSRIAAILNSLERKALISREIDGADRRRIHVTLTVSGKKLVMERHRVVHNSIVDVLRQLGEGDSQEVIRLLDRFIDIYKTMTPDKTDCANNHVSKGEPLP